MSENSPLVSIVLPVYGVEDYIEKAVRTLFEQTYSNIEYVFVNDCTKDRSIEILYHVLKCYPNRVLFVNIIEKQKNEGVSKARKTGNQYINGKNVHHLDPDDCVEYDMVERLVECAESNECDVVYADYFYSLDGGEEQIINEVTVNNKTDLLRSIFLGKIGGCYWSKLFKASLFEGIIYTDYFTFEDLVGNVQLILKANKICHLKKPLYHYRSVVKKLDDSKMLSAQENLKLIDGFLADSGNKKVLNSFKYFIDRRKLLYLSRYGLRKSFYSDYLWTRRPHTDIFSLGLQFRDTISIRAILRFLKTYFSVVRSDIYFLFKNT